MSDFDKYTAANKKLWDAKVPVHIGSEFYDNEAFINGKQTLTPIELAEIGEVNGKSLLHLQCHFGQDTMSFSRMGAKTVGVDLSTAAINVARELNEQLGLDARFVESDVLKLDEKLDEQFDIVFTSYGTTCWFYDINRWAELVAQYTKVGGHFYFADFHPILNSFSLDWSKLGDLSYFSEKEPTHDVEQGTYADRESAIALEEYFWNHSISETVNALLSRGFQLEFLNEHNYSPYAAFPNMREDKPGEHVFEGFGRKIPYVYSFRMKRV